MEQIYYIRTVEYKVINDRIVIATIYCWDTDKVFKGKAKLNPEEDVFDEQFGKDLAFARALEKLCAKNWRISDKNVDLAHRLYANRLRINHKKQKEIMRRIAEIDEIYAKLDAQLNNKKESK